jgi:transposase
MKYHANAKLTVHLRRAMREEFLGGATSIKKLAARYHVSTKTVQKWVHREEPTDRSSAPRRRRSKRPPGLASAVRRRKKAHPRQGTRRIAHELRPYYPGLTRNRVRHILKAAKLLGQRHRRLRRPRRPLPVGRHRVQMDVQQLPAVRGGTGYEYKITVIHMRTRVKYSEIHPDHCSPTVAGVLIRSLERLPPFRLVWTDNAMEFTMRYTAHPDRHTAFQQRLMALSLRHGTCRPRSPWQNGIVERSHRTDNEELFKVLHFQDAEERRYQLRLYEMHYAAVRPHQGLGGLTPLQAFQRDYPLHATSRMLGTPSPYSSCQGAT